MIDAGGTGSSTINITLPDSNYNNMYSGGISLTGGGISTTYTIGPSDTITIGNIDTGSIFTWEEPKEWVDCFPDWARVKDMCEKYPGLEIALRNFETIYNLVKDDYDNPVPKK